jgi:undecaprenyl-phosphate 4-deoxy-4-formamido-L-arabinose transferase
MRKITIIIPVFNSENTIFFLVKKIIEQINHVFLEIILVNDCSYDKSEQKCIELYEHFPDIIKFFSLAKNVGEHNAVMAGLNNATGDFVIIIDDDFQNPISEIIKLIDFSLENNYDVVYTFYELKKHSLFRNIGSKFNDFVANWLLNKPKKLYLSSFKSISNFIVNEIIKYDLPYPYIDGLILRTTNNIGKIKVQHDKRQEGKSQYTLVKLISLWMNMVTNFSVKPLRLATYLGFLVSVISFIMIIVVIVMKYIDPTVPPGYSSLLVTISFLGGIQLIAIGMVGEYIGRTFLSINKAPQYVIKRKYE